MIVHMDGVVLCLQIFLALTDASPLLFCYWEPWSKRTGYPTSVEVDGWNFVIPFGQLFSLGLCTIAEESCVNKKCILNICG